MYESPISAMRGTRLLYLVVLDLFTLPHNAMFWILNLSLERQLVLISVGGGIGSKQAAASAPELTGCSTHFNLHLEVSTLSLLHNYSHV